MAKQHTAIYMGVDNYEEIEIVYTRKTVLEIQRLAKRAGVSELELLVKYVARVDLAALAGMAEGMRARKASKKRK
jgi:hypothetical protein